MNELVIGIDVGTTGTKAVLVAEDGTVVATAYRGYAVTHDQVRAEQDPEDWWTALVAVVREIASVAPRDAIKAISVSAQGGSTIFADRDGRAILPARSWLDARPEIEAEQLAARFDRHEFYRRTGWRLNPRYNAAQILNLRNDAPKEFAGTGRFLATADFINFRLSGRAVADINGAGITQLLSLATQHYDEEILQFLEIDEERLAELVPSGSVIGEVTPAAAVELGVPQSTLVVAGGHDQYCASLGAGAFDESTLLLSAGTAWVVLGSTDAVVLDPSEHFAAGSHVVPGRWGQFGSLLNGGASIEWVRRLLASGGDPLPFEVLNAEAMATTAGSDGLVFLPHFGGTVPDWNDASRGSFIGLELSHERRHVIRAALEGIAAEAVELIDLYRGRNPAMRSVRMIGGATRSEIWPQMLADMLGDPVEVPASADAAALGAAILAAAADPAAIDAAADRMRRPVAIFDPSPDRERYAAGRARVRAFAQQLSSTYAAEMR